ncbi:MAG: hypothetical protein WA849_13575 [Candidatus Udaeobacter sp.]
MQTLSVLSRLTPALFVHDFDPLVDYLAGEPTDRHVHQVMQLTFHNKFS